MCVCVSPSQTYGRVREGYKVWESIRIGVDESPANTTRFLPPPVLREPPHATYKEPSFPARRAEGVAGVAWVAARRELSAEHQGPRHDHCSRHHHQQHSPSLHSRPTKFLRAGKYTSLRRVRKVEGKESRDAPIPL